MENTELPLSKAEYNYIRTIEKADELIAKQEASLDKVKSEKEALKASYAELLSENEKLKADIRDTTKECQLHIDDIEAQNDDLEQQIGELRAQALTKEEMLFYHGCKADIMLSEMYPEKREFTMKELKEKKFPMVVLESKDGEPSGFITPNFELIKQAEKNVYHLSKK